MKKTIINFLLSIFLISSVESMDDQEKNSESIHSNNYAETNDYGDLNQLLIGSKIKAVDANVRTKRISHRKVSTQKHEIILPDNNSDCLFLFYCFGFCCSIFGSTL